MDLPGSLRRYVVEDGGTELSDRLIKGADSRMVPRLMFVNVGGTGVE